MFKQVVVLDKSFPVFNRDSISGLAVVNNSNVEWTGNVGVGISKLHPLAERE